MKKHIFYIVLLLFLGLAAHTNAQTDKWTGTWRMEYKPWPGRPPLIIELQVGLPGQQTLYPALLKLDYGNTFHGVYELLLATKSATQLGIGRFKYPVSETPFRLGPWMLYLNGTFNYGKPANGAAYMQLSRMWIKDFGLFMRGLDDDDEIYTSTKVTLRGLLYQDSIRLKKINAQPWTGPHTNRIIHPEEDSIYFGIYDKVITADSVVQLTIKDDDQLDKDTVTLVHNGRVLLHRMEMNDQTREQRIHLDTGMNILTFFADNYGGLPPNTGNMRITTEGKTHVFDFAHRANWYATYLVAQFYRKPAVPIAAIKALPPPTTTRKNESLTSFTVHQADIILELWDAQQEDGDSISLRLNDNGIATGLPVKKSVQQIKISLQPGENTLLFMADNLGSIPPNTAALRIRFGTQAKTLELKTDFQRNNLVKIVYDPPTQP